jgi:hypothetical protein
VHARAPYAVGRAAAATTVTVTGAAAAHTWAGGTVPTGPGLALVAAVVLGASLLVFRHDVPGWALLPLVAAAQLGVHTSFGLVGPHDHTVVATPDPGWSWQMVAAHAFVTVLAAVLWWLGRRAASYAVRLRSQATLPVLVRLRRAAAPPVHLSLVQLLVPLLRGPPRASTSA